MPAKNSAQYNNYQTEKHPESRKKPVCFVLLSTDETVKKTHMHLFLVIVLKKEQKIKQNKT